MMGKAGVVADLQEGMASGREGETPKSLKVKGAGRCGKRGRGLLWLLRARRDHVYLWEEGASELGLKLSTHQFLSTC